MLQILIKSTCQSSLHVSYCINVIENTFTQGSKLLHIKGKEKKTKKNRNTINRLKVKVSSSIVYCHTIIETQQ